MHRAAGKGDQACTQREKKEGAFPATTDAVDCRSLRSPPPEELSVLKSIVSFATTLDKVKGG